jgi:hypothetical protein
MFPTALIMDVLGLVLMARAGSGSLLIPLLRKNTSAAGKGAS